MSTSLCTVTRILESQIRIDGPSVLISSASHATKHNHEHTGDSVSDSDIVDEGTAKRVTDDQQESLRRGKRPVPDEGQAQKAPFEVQSPATFLMPSMTQKFTGASPVYIMGHIT